MQLNPRMRLWPCIALLTATASGADMVRHPHEAGLTGSLGFDYDGSRHRTYAYGFEAELEWGTKNHWLSLTFDTYSGLQGDWRLRGDGYATLQLGTALHRDNDARLYVNATLDLDAHSILASQGADITPEINAAWGITEDWWIGGNLGAVLATDPDEGNRRGYGSLTLWLTWLCGWLPDESDSLSLSVWAATNEEPGADKALFISLEYEFDLTDSLEASLGLGTDPSSPWDHLGLFATAGLTWRF